MNDDNLSLNAICTYRCWKFPKNEEKLCQRNVTDAYIARNEEMKMQKTVLYKGRTSKRIIGALAINMNNHKTEHMTSTVTTDGKPNVQTHVQSQPAVEYDKNHAAREKKAQAMFVWKKDNTGTSSALNMNRRGGSYKEE